MAIICRSLALLFIQAPRTGCSAIGTLLREQFDGERLLESSIRGAFSRVIVPKKHCTLDQLDAAGVLAAEDRSRLLTFTTVRNPYDSLVSLYWKRRSVPDEVLADADSWLARSPRDRREIMRCRRYSFDQWLSRRLTLPAFAASLRLYRPSMFDRFTHGVDVVMRFEQLEDDFNAVLTRVGVDRRITIPRKNPTAGRADRYREQYSARSRRLVERVFARDLGPYDYSF